MTGATATKERRAKVESTLDAADVLAEMEVAKRRALAESELYRRVVFSAAVGSASADDIQAARIVGAKWNWDYDSDMAALVELARIREKFGDDCVAAGLRLWDELTAKADELRAYHEASRKRLMELELERRDLQGKHQSAHTSGERVQRIHRERPHLFASGERGQ